MVFNEGGSAVDKTWVSTGPGYYNDVTKQMIRRHTISLWFREKEEREGGEERGGRGERREKGERRGKEGRVKRGARDPGRIRKRELSR